MGGLTAKQLFIVIITAMALSSGITVLIFLESRNDPNLRVAALVGAFNIPVAFTAIASTLLTGKDLTQRHDPADLPPGSTQTDATITNISPAPQEK
jgi:hypothetical protein